MIETIEPYRLPGSVNAELLALAAEVDLLVLGECHGTQEVPRLVLGLLDDLARLGYRGLALEFASDERQELNAWTRKETPDPPQTFGRDNSFDGRHNVQTLSLIRQALARPEGWQLLCFDHTKDVHTAGWAERDAMMAALLLEQWEQQCPDRKVIAICGNLHSRLHLSPGAYEDCWPAFAYNVQQRRPPGKVASIDVIPHSGAFFNGELKSFYPPAGPLLTEAEIRPQSRLGHTLELHLPSAIAATFLDSHD